MNAEPQTPEPVVESDIVTVGHVYPSPTSPATEQPAASDDPPPANPEAAAATESDPKTPNTEATADTEHDDDAPRQNESPQQHAARTRSRLQKRIDDLTAARYTEKGRADRLEQELADVRRQMQALPRTPETPATPGASTTPDETSAPQTDGFVFATPKPKSEDFDDYDAYTDALTDWKLDYRTAKTAHEREVAERRAREEAITRQRAEAQAKSVERANAFKAEHQDFDDVIGALDFRVEPAVIEALHGSEYGPHILYALGTDAEAAKAFAALTPAQQIREIGRREAAFERTPQADPAPPAVVPPATPKPVTSKAPEPLTPVSRPAAASGKRLQDMTSEERIEFFANEERQKRMGGRGR